VTRKNGQFNQENGGETTTRKETKTAVVRVDGLTSPRMVVPSHDPTRFPTEEPLVQYANASNPRDGWERRSEDISRKIQKARTTKTTAARKTRNVRNLADVVMTSGVSDAAVGDFG